MKRILLLCVVLAGCAASPMAPLVNVPATPSYVVMGDSLGLGAYFPMVQAAIGGTWRYEAIGSTFIHTQWQPDGSAFLHLTADVTDRPTAFLCHLGANDTVLQPPPTTDSVFADLQRMTSALAADYPGSVVYLSDVGQVWTYGDKTAENAQVRAAIERAWREIPTVRQGPMLRDLTPDDGVHFTSPQNVQTIADRWIAVLKGQR